MRVMVEKLLNQFGTDVTVGDRRVRAIFQGMTGNMERLAVPEPGVLGLESRKRYVYIGPLEPQLQEDETVTVAGKEYRIRTAQQISGGSGPVYTWAMCVEKGRGDDWGMNC